MIVVVSCALVDLALGAEALGSWVAEQLVELRTRQAELHAWTASAPMAAEASGTTAIG